MFRSNVGKIFPLSDLTNSYVNGGDLSTCIESIFGRVYLSNIAIRDNLNFGIFKFIVEFLADLLGDMIAEDPKTF